MTTRSIVGLALLVLVATACSSRTPGASAQGPMASIDPAKFVATIDNSFLPFKPGTKWVYDGVRDGQSLHDELVVTDRTKKILGVTCVVVTDVATQIGRAHV